MKEIISQIDEFSAIGVNHWKADVALRERFSLSKEQRGHFLEDARIIGLRDVIILSTCNRTEIFARTASPGLLTELLVKHSGVDREVFDGVGFQFTGEQAIRHLFRVAVGLEAQILGDLQISRQVKEAYEDAHALGLIDAVMHRLMQYVLKSHKRTRTETGLASGAATVAYAAVQFAKKRLGSIRDKRIVLVGTGKIGKITCKNLLSMGAANITLLNRNRKKAENLARRFDLPVSGFEHLENELADADLAIVATSSDRPVILKQHLNGRASGSRQMVILDLSVPRNVDPEIDHMPGTEVVNMDWLNDTTDEAFRQRERHVPTVESIIDEELGNFRVWLSEQKVVPTIRALSDKLHEIRSKEMDRFRSRIPGEAMSEVDDLTRRIVNKIMAHSIDHLREHHEAPDEIKRVVHSMFKLEPEPTIER